MYFDKCKVIQNTVQSVRQSSMTSSVYICFDDDVINNGDEIIISVIICIDSN
jgi:hypothetical protein